MLRVFKFGGALMKDADGIRRVGSIVEEFSCEPLVLIVSALGKTTNALETILKLAQEKKEDKLLSAYYNLKKLHLDIVSELFPDNTIEISSRLDLLFREYWDILNQEYESIYKAYDQTVGYGEQFSSIIVEAYLKEKNLKAINIDARKIIVTNSNYTDASVNWKYTDKTINSCIKPLIDTGKIVLSQGFTGADEKGNFTTLGREGSDFTAAIFASILDADELIIWKDVPGLMNADPKRFDDCIKLDKISYHEAIELAFYGASVIHPKTIQPLKSKNIELNVKSFYNPSMPGSIISSDSSEDEKFHKIIVKDNQVLLSITSKNLDFISEENLTFIFKAFSKNKVHINLMQNSAVSFSVCFDYDELKLESLTKLLQDQFYLRHNSDLELLTVRHYNDQIVSNLIGDKKVYLEQKSRSTIQLLVKV